jgi:AraC family transcriptional regulator
MMALLGRLIGGRRGSGEAAAQKLTVRQADLARDADSLLVRNSLEEVSLGRLARLLGVTAPHLARCYRAATGRTLHERLTSLRMANAMDRLAKGSVDLTELALDLGFSSHSHFTAAFRQHVGMPPRAYRAYCSA